MAFKRPDCEARKDYTKTIVLGQRTEERGKRREDTGYRIESRGQRIENKGQRTEDSSGSSYCEQYLLLD